MSDLSSDGVEVVLRRRLFELENNKAIHRMACAIPLQSRCDYGLSVVVVKAGVVLNNVFYRRRGR